MGDAPEVSHGWALSAAAIDVPGSIKNVSPPDVTVDDVDTSNQDTLVAHTYAPSPLQEPGNLTFDAQFDPSFDPSLGVTDVFTLEAPTGGKWIFSGYMNGYDPDAPHLEVEMVACSIKVSGPITIVGSATSSSVTL